MDFILDNLAFGLIVTAGIFFLIFMASALSEAHADKRKACVEAGYKWSATKYVCVVEPKK